MDSHKHAERQTERETRYYAIYGTAV